MQFPMNELIADEKTKRRVFAIHTGRMTVTADATYDAIFTRDEAMSGADLKAICTEAGLRALRDRRKTVTLADFKLGVETTLTRKAEACEALYL